MDSDKYHSWIIKSGVLFKGHFSLNNQLLPTQQKTLPQSPKEYLPGGFYTSSDVKRETLLVKKHDKLYRRPQVITVAGGWIPVLRTRKKVVLRSGLFAGPTSGHVLHNIGEKENFLYNLWTSVG